MALKDTHKLGRAIVLNFTEVDYARFMHDLSFAHQTITQCYKAHPHRFPSQMAQGYKCNGRTTPSKKMGYRMRKLKIGDHYYVVRPSFVMPYMSAHTDDVYKPLFLLRFGVPFRALAYVFGRNRMFWYRLYMRLGTFSVVGTSIHKADQLPEDVLADEHHIRIKGQKAYVATTVGANCILGAQAVHRADTETLEAGYAIFKEETCDLDPDYKPKTVNTDGWPATQLAWRSLFAHIFIIECFLHAFIKVRDRATKAMQEIYHQAADRLWEAYRAENKRSMGQRIRRLHEWTQEHVPECAMKENLIKLWQKKKRWLAHLDFPLAYRTSAHLDRLMKFMERHAIAYQMFHGSLDTTTTNMRAFALLYNFTPALSDQTEPTPVLTCPVAKLNGFVYHKNWLQNLLIAASCGGYRHSTQIRDT